MLQYFFMIMVLAFNFWIQHLKIFEIHNESCGFTNTVQVFHSELCINKKEKHFIIF